jgi:hypothetical protein
VGAQSSGQRGSASGRIARVANDAIRLRRPGRIANAALLIVLSFVCGFTAAGLNGWYNGRDFHCFWVAGRIAASGGDPYDARQYVPETVTIPPSPAWALHRCGPRLSYPPWTGIALAPFGALPLPAAATLWASLAVMAAVLGVSWTWQLAGRGGLSWPLVALLVVATEPFARNFAEGQFGTFVLALTAGTARSLLSDKDWAAGIYTAALSVKPHTAAGFAAAVLLFAILRRRWRVVGASGAVALGLAGLSQLLRPGWLSEFLTRATELSGSIGDRATIWNLAGSWPQAVLTIALLLALVVVLTRQRVVNESDVLGFAVAFSLVVTPYAWSHDYIVLAIPWSMTIGHARPLPPLPRYLLTVSTVIVAGPVLWILPAVATVRGSESLSVVVPMITAVLLAFAIRWSVSGRKPSR